MLWLSGKESQFYKEDIKYYAILEVFFIVYMVPQKVLSRKERTLMIFQLIILFIY